MKNLRGKTPTCLAAVLLAALCLFANGCTSFEIISKWRGDREIVIDGIDSEWQGARFLIDKERITIGAMNDNEYLYLRISSSDRFKQMRMLRYGLTLWFEPGGKVPKRGIRYPVGRPNDGEHLQPQTALDSEATADTLVVSLMDSLDTSIGVMEPDDVMSLLVPIEEANDSGISVAISHAGAILVYEIKVPLSPFGDGIFSAGVLPGDELGIGIVLGKPDRDQYMKAMTEHAGGARNPNIRRMDSRGFSSPMFEDIETWVRVILAKKK